MYGCFSRVDREGRTTALKAAPAQPRCYGDTGLTQHPRNPIGVGSACLRERDSIRTHWKVQLSAAVMQDIQTPTATSLSLVVRATVPNASMIGCANEA